MIEFARVRAEKSREYRGGVSRFAMQFDPSEIGALAERFAYEDDPAVRAAGEAVRSRGHYTREEFLRVCEWKSARSRPKVAANDTKAIEVQTALALTSHDEAGRMEALTALEGLGVPTASVLLHFAFPSDYPILDVRALESLGVRGRSTYPLSFWLEYLAACRHLAAEHGVSLRTLDKALWQHSRERVG